MSALERTFESTSSKLGGVISQLEQEIKNLEIIAVAEAKVEAQKNSWTAWFQSPWRKVSEESEQEKSCIDRKRQERKIEKDMKERRLDTKKTEMKKE